MSEWTPISGYTPQNYTDTLTYKVHSSTKQVEKVTGQALVAGEKNSQYICFTWDRFWDGIDISTKTFSIDYALAGQYYGTSDAVNAEMSDNEIRFGWIVPENACAISGTLLFVLKVESEDYVLKTQIGETPVWKTINVEDVVPEPTKEAWYRDFEERVGLAIHSAESALAQAQTAVETAVASAESAQEASATAQEAMIESKVRYGSPLVAKTINDMVEQNRVYVYAGSETGYTFGHWYYYDSDNGVWVDGGVYNGSAVNTDKTLTQGDIPADSKATGDAISELKSGLDGLNLSSNVIPNDYYSGDDFTTKGIHFVKNADGSVSSSGISTDTARYYWLYDAEVLAGTYELGGIPEGSNSQSYFLEYKIGENSFRHIYTKTIVTINPGEKVYIRTGYRTGYTDTGHVWRVYLAALDNTVFLDSDYNPKIFVPYVLANKDTPQRLGNLENDAHWEFFDSTYAIGSLTSDGAETTSTTRVSSGYIPTKACKLFGLDGYRYAVHYYATASSTHSSASAYWLTGNYTLLTTYPYFRYVAEKVPAVTVQSGEVETYGQAVRVDLRTQIVKDIDAISERVSAIENTDTLPDYWETYLTTRIPQINSAICDVGNHGIVFTFFSDYHYPLSEAYYLGYTWLPKILKRIKEKCPVETFINGGDLLTNNPTAAEALAILEQFREDYNFLGLLNILGNHDKNHYGSEELSDDDVYAILYRGMGMEKSVNLDPGMYWYLDNPTQKTRIIALNVSTETYNVWMAQTAQHQWFVDTLNSTPSGYTIVIMPHVFFTLSSGSLVVSAIGQNIQSIVDAYASRGAGTWNDIAYDFANADGTIACILCGHTHNDGMIESSAGYPMIGVVCDAMYGSRQSVTRGNSVKGTVAEHAFDIVCIDTTAHTIDCVRVGSGSDRSYTYGQ